MKDGFSCHFTPLDVLMATGLIGGIAMFVAFWGSLRGCFWVVKNYPRGYWIVGIYIFCFLDACMHGDATSPFIYALGIALVADCMSRNVANMPISLGGRVNDKLEIC